MADYSEFNEAPDQTDALGKISALADKCVDLDRQIEEAQGIADALQSQRDDIAEHLLPDLFAEVGQTVLKTTSGRNLKLVEKITHSVSKDRKASVMAWLDEHGFGGLIKRAVTVAFNKGDEENVKLLLDVIDGAFHDTRIDQEVAAASLGKLIRDELAAGHEIPLDLFGVFQKVIVEIK
jgi:hypothetical protein